MLQSVVSTITIYLSCLPTQCLAALLLSAFTSVVVFSMLGTRTKQVSSYGRRNRRIINNRHDLFDAEHIKDSETRECTGNGHAPLFPNTPTCGPPSGAGKRLKITSATPSTISSPRPSHNRNKKRRENNQARSSLKHIHSPSSSRNPLNSHSVNISRHSTLSGPKKKAKLPTSKDTGMSLAPQSPIVNVDIFVLDENGRRVSQERRTSNPNVQVNQHSTIANVIVVSDNDDDGNSVSPTPFSRRAKRWPRVVASSDEENMADSPIRPVSSLISPRLDPNRNDPAEKSVSTDLLAPSPSSHSSPKRTMLPKSQFWVEITTHRRPLSSRNQPQEHKLDHYSPLRLPSSKARQLTPIRRNGHVFRHLPPSPSTPSDLDISNDLAHLALLPTPLDDHTLPDQPLNLIPLLSECGQTAPVEFSAFIEAFPVDPVVRSSCSGKAAFQKIGEASYSEVFGIGDVVLKIVPIRNEECADNIEAETPAPSDAKDVLNEIVVTYALSEMCDGFVNLLKTYVVRGKYPSVLLDLWDEYNRTKGSENVRPGVALPHIDAARLV
jgi:serine/threonine-protein kinase haspin